MQSPYWNCYKNPAYDLYKSEHFRRSSLIPERILFAFRIKNPHGNNREVLVMDVPIGINDRRYIQPQTPSRG